jgi:acyl carrier protein
MIEAIRRAIETKGNLRVSSRYLTDQTDLYAAGLTPLAAIEVMIEIERELGITFPERMLNRQSMVSIERTTACVREALVEGVRRPAAAYAEAA